MGLTLTVRPGTPLPAWPRIAAEMQRRGLAVHIRMIDGQLAFPDESPPDDWRELRLGTPGGMVSVVRSADAVAAVVWGNADEGLRRDWHTIAAVLADLTGGSVLPPSE